MKYLLLFTLLLLTKFGDTLKQDRWGQYLDVYNIVLTNTFLGESTLLEAIRQKDATPQKFGDLSYACTTYSEGDEICKFFFFNLLQFSNKTYFIFFNF